MLYKPFYDKTITPKDKKYSVYTKHGVIHFGDIHYQQYHDKIGRYKNLDHWDKKRRANYLKRAKGIKGKNGYSWKDKDSPNYWSVHYLW